MKKMALTDLTHPILEGMPVFPGEKGPSIRHLATIAGNGYRVKWLELGSHTGTHMDAPAHLLPEGKTLDQFPVSHFSGKAVIVSILSGVRMIEVSLLEKYEKEIRSSSFLLIHTGWSSYWGREQYFQDFPVLSEEAAHWLAGAKLHGIGLDTISADPVDSALLPIHHIILGAGLVIIENLNFPRNFLAESGIFHCFPLKITEADGSPVRAVIQVDDKKTPD